MAERVVVSAQDLAARVGEEIAVSDWLEVTQASIDQFAQATGDHQWIHVDVERSRRESPFGATIAHGFLTLSLLSRLFGDTLQVAGSRMGVNYGCNRLRFTAPVTAGSHIRARFRLKDLTAIDGGVQMAWDVQMEQQGAEKPCLVAEWLTRRYD